MPQLEARAVARWARRGHVPKYLVERARRFSPTEAQRRILRAVDGADDPLPTAATRVRVTRRRVPVRSLRVTQSEGRDALVRALADRLEAGARLDPVVVTRGGRVIDGHHRFWAHKLLGRRTIDAVELHLAHGPAMRLAWAAGGGVSHSV